MACPLVAAAFALISEARGTLDPVLIRSLLASTAKPQLFMLDEWADWLAPPAQQSAGIVQVYDTAFATTLIEPIHLNFNDADNFVETLNFTIKTDDNKQITYEIGHVPTHTLYALKEDALTKSFAPHEDTSAHAELTFSKSKLTLAASDSATIQVTAVPPEGIQNARYPLWSGYVAVNASDGSSLSLSYHGLPASLHKAISIKKDGAWLGMTTLPPTQRVPANTTFTLLPKGITPGEFDVDQPRIYMEFEWGSSKVKTYLIPGKTSSSNSTRTAHGVNVIGELPMSPQLWGGKHLIGIGFHGLLKEGDYATAGTYKFLVAVLRIGGDE